MGDIALIVGGGSGIGKACARRFAEQGYPVAIAGHQAGPLEAAASGIGCKAYPVDVRSSASIQQMMRQIAADGHQVRILVNTAGINATQRSFAQMDDAQSEDIIRTNLTGAVHLSRAVISEMRKSGGGSIIHLGSSAGVRASALSGVAYSATKRALFSLVRSINLEEAKNGIRATVIAPATVNTDLLLSRPMVPSEEERKQALQPEDIAQMAYFVATQPKHVVIDRMVVTSGREVEWG